MSVTEKYVFGILSIRGHDRIGVAADASAYLVAKGAHITHEDSRTLGEYFTGMVKFKVPWQGMEDIKRTYRTALPDLQPEVVGTNEAAPHQGRVVVRYELAVFAEDDPRISATVEEIMHKRCINMKEIRSGTIKSYGHGRDLYSGTFHLDCGNAATIRALEEDLKTLEDGFGWEIVLRHLDAPTRRFEVFTVGVPTAGGKVPALDLRKEEVKNSSGPD